MFLLQVRKRVFYDAIREQLFQVRTVVRRKALGSSFLRDWSCLLVLFLRGDRFRDAIFHRGLLRRILLFRVSLHQLREQIQRSHINGLRIQAALRANTHA